MFSISRSSRLWTSDTRLQKSHLLHARTVSELACRRRQQDPVTVNSKARDGGLASTGITLASVHHQGKSTTQTGTSEAGHSRSGCCPEDTSSLASTSFI